MDPERYEAARKALESLRQEKSAKTKGSGIPPAKKVGPPVDASKCPPILVGESLDDPHAFVSLTRKCLERVKPSEEDGLLRPVEVRRLNVCVTPGQVLRGLLLFDALIKALATMKATVAIGHGDKCRTHAKVNGEEVEIRLKETCVRKPRALSAEEKARVSRHPMTHGVRMTELRPTGTLMFSIGGGMDSLRKDEPSRPLEGRLDTVVDLIHKVAAAAKARRAKLAREASEAAARQKKQAEQRLEDAEERGFVEWFDRQLAAWRSAKEIRAFVADARAEAERRSVIVEPGSSLSDWLEWMERRAESIDPIPAFISRNRGHG